MAHDRPTVRYRDVPGALDWLATAFGCREHLVVRGEGDAIAHAQLGRGVVMVGSAIAEDTEYGSREDTARDLESHLWSFATDRPEPVSEGGGALMPGAPRAGAPDAVPSPAPKRPAGG